MIKIEKAQFNSLTPNFKCGEVFCLDTKSYQVMCEFCGDQVSFHEFLKHFGELHLPPEDGKTTILDELDINKDDFNADVDDNDDIYEDYIRSFNASSNNLNKAIPEEEEKQGATRIQGNEKCDDTDEKPIRLDELEIAQLETFVEIFDNDGRNSKSPKIELADFSTTSSYAFSDGDANHAEEDFESKADFLLDSYLNEEKQLKSPRVPCPHCNNEYKNKSSLQKHIQNIHNQAEKEKPKKAPVISKENPKPFKCEYCDKEYRLESQWRHHRYSHTGIICDICGKKFSQVGNMMAHKRRHNAPKAFQCQECPYRSITEKELKAHMTCHNREPVVCELCGITVRDRYKMPAHMKRHNNDRPAKCEVCGKRFFCNYDLKIHSATHTNERPFECEICGSTFQIKKSLRVHKKVHMKDLPKPFVCQVCSKAFYLEKGLVAHMRTHDPDYMSLRKLKDDIIQPAGFPSGI